MLFLALGASNAKAAKPKLVFESTDQLRPQEKTQGKMTLLINFDRRLKKQLKFGFGIVQSPGYNSCAGVDNVSILKS